MRAVAVYTHSEAEAVHYGPPPARLVAGWRYRGRLDVPNLQHATLRACADELFGRDPKVGAVRLFGLGDPGRLVYEADHTGAHERDGWGRDWRTIAAEWDRLDACGIAGE